MRLISARRNLLILLRPVRVAQILSFARPAHSTPVCVVRLRRRAYWLPEGLARRHIVNGRMAVQNCRRLGPMRSDGISE
jgi:hypothetical protein